VVFTWTDKEITPINKNRPLQHYFSVSRGEPFPQREHYFEKQFILL